jgi:cyanate permease
LGAARGLAVSFISMTAIVFLVGALSPFTSTNAIKTCLIWFPSRQLGLASGLISMGMAAGFLIGSLASATLLSPLLGGWQYVFLLYGALGALMCIPWFFTRTHPSEGAAADAVRRTSMRQTLAHVMRLRNVWLLGLTVFGVGGCVQGLLGYLPLYLRSIGWEPLRADGALSAFHTISLICTMPIALWSDRLGSRKGLLFVAGGMVALGTGLLSITGGALVWVCVLMAGFVRDAFMAIYTTMVFETEGVGAQYAGTALGFTGGVSNVGALTAPPLGNSLAGFQPAAPFALWAGWAVFGMLCLALVKGRARPPIPALAPEGQ